MKVNPAIFDPLVSSSKKTIVQQGGSSCFAHETLVVTSTGLKPISQIQQGDQVKSFNEVTGEIQFNTVTDVLQFKNTKPTIRINLKNGHSITATEDHKFYYNGGWYSLKHLLSLVEPPIKDK
jgi:DNA polymerase II large subunit